MSNTRQQVLDDIKVAMKAGDKPRLGTLRLIAAEIKQKEVDERITLDDQAMVTLLDRMLKQRRDSVRQYSEAGRDDLVAVEEAEMVHIQTYLPEALGEADIDALIEQAVSDTGAAAMRDMGKVMGLVKPQLQGRADMGLVSQRVKQRLNTD